MMKAMPGQAGLQDAMKAVVQAEQEKTPFERDRLGVAMRACVNKNPEDDIHLEENRMEFKGFSREDAQKYLNVPPHQAWEGADDSGTYFALKSLCEHNIL